MAKKKQQQLLRTPNNSNTDKKISKKIKKKNNNATIVPISTFDQTIDHTSSDSDEEQNPSERIQKLLEPYTKDQLIEFIIDAAVNDPSLANRIRDAADRDVSHRKIFVYGLSWDTTKETLISAFKPYGEIEDSNVVMDRVTGKAKGFGFVQFKSRKGAMKALKEPKKKIGSRMASCQLASVGPAAATGAGDTSSRKIYVSNVQQDVDPERLRAFFSKFGEIDTGPLGFDTSTGKSRGFALFVYKNQEGFRKALEEPYKMFEGHQLHCQKAAEGKNKGTSPASATDVTLPVLQQATPSVLAAVAAAQNLAYFGQQPGLNLNPLYGGLFPNHNAGILAANPLYTSGALGQVGAVGGAPLGLGAYGAFASHGLNVGGDGSLLGDYGGSTGSAVDGLGLQHAYPNKKVGQSSGSSSRSQGAAGRSFSGYSSHLCYESGDLSVVKCGSFNNRIPIDYFPLD